MGFYPLGFCHRALLNDPESFDIRASTERSPAPSCNKTPLISVFRQTQPPMQ